MNFKLKKRYFDGNIKSGFVALYSSKSIIRIAGGLFGIFLPIFLYGIFENNFSKVAWYYIASDFFYIILIPLGAIFLNRLGFRRALRISVFFGAFFYGTFYFASVKNALLISVISLTFLVLWRITHWIPYHVDFAKFTDKKNRGREVGLLEATTDVIGVITPFAAGLIISRAGFGTLFLIAVAIYLASYIPLLTIPKTREKFSWKYFQTWKEFFSRQRRANILAYMADGAENTVGAVVWPIFIFELLKGNYAEVGFISALITGTTIILQILMGKYVDEKFSKKKFIHFGSTLYALGWIFKIFVITSFQIFVIDAYHKLMKIFLRVPFDALTYEIAADEGHFVDEYTVIHEMALSFGKVAAMLLIIPISLSTNLSSTFLIAALASIVLNFLRAKKVAEAS
ncbi:MAG: Uncharacterized protein Athens101428_123 [Candidatus Berkelbacteria bacterium Athens1014_28]|uniref:Major facilitator superfamily (MFS) profile domain-containing protein n=1 Tax=Candidatus Berkelbacteria bacterium Athens1014_28 TaxID=2017145 RepID=A0A554LPN5_9BACT|nr:MAG: Uncharacterized protein Athens101428_123 [Candidatus Berkelbacteria bacterium Athens1014_28]